MNPNPEPRLNAPIPIPLRRRWREFRIRIVPVIAFVMASAVAIKLWRAELGSPTMQGQAEAITAAVTSPETGALTELNVARFQRVRAGEPIALIVPSPSGAPLTLIRAEIELLRARLDPVLGRQQNATDSERLRLEWLIQRADLAAARVELARAENELTRDDALFKAQVISADLYDATLKMKERISAEVTEKQHLIEEVQLAMDQLRVLGEAEPAAPAAETTLALLKLQETRLNAVELSLSPITLFAPIDGMVSVVYRQTGENVGNGDPIVTIAALESPRIVGHLRQPFPVDPQIGMMVQVRTHSRPQRVASTRVVNVGAQMEPITNAIILARSDRLADIGLPIAISTPPELNLRPGELVDLVLVP